MALRDQPYLPLYIQDVLTDEKLIECSAESHGVYFRLLCLLHKQERYGLLCMKQRYKQNLSKYENFASLLARQMPFEAKQIQKCLTELEQEGVIIITDMELYQKRMVRDGELSLIRAETGKKGGSILTKQYGKEGFLYLMSDRESKHKIGISVNPQNRLYRLRSDLKLKKSFDIVDVFEVKDMGKSEDAAQSFFSDILDGEWLLGDIKMIENKFALLKANYQAKVEANTEYEITNENVLKMNNKGGVGEISAINPINPDLMGFLGRVRHWMETEHNYIWSDQDSKAASGLEAKLKELHRRDNLHTDDKTLFQSYQLMVNRLDGWVKTNKFSLTYFNNNFNEIITGIKSGKQGNNADEKRRAGVARIFHELTTGPQFD